MTSKTLLSLVAGAALVAACGQNEAASTNTAAAMPTPTVSTQADAMSTATQMSTLSMINAKVRKPIDGRPTAGYLTIENSGTTPERLIGLSSPDFGRVELHTTTMDGAMMKMEKLDGLDIAPASQAVMEPGGKHIMLFDPTRALNNGDSVKITLTFSNSGPIETNFVVLNEIPRKDGAMSGADHSGHK
jgi:periplasmic copper chaperone A